MEGNNQGYKMSGKGDNLENGDDGDKSNVMLGVVVEVIGVVVVVVLWLSICCCCVVIVGDVKSGTSLINWVGSRRR